MKELQEIIARLKQIAPEESAVLATVVDVRGSGYRLPGARMLITGAGETFGTVSGGCLEADVLERAKQVVETGASTIIIYDTRGADDSVFSLNMGCHGVTRILLEPARDNRLFDFLSDCLQNRKRGTIATLIESNDTTIFKTGARLFVSDTSRSDFADADFAPELIADTLAVSQNGVSRVAAYETADTKLEFFIEAVKPPVSLVVFGAGHDAIPLIDFAKNLGWQTTVVDHRAAFANAERFPNADAVVLTRPESINEKNLFDENTATVVMTHNYEFDKRILSRLLKMPLIYVGALGPKPRTLGILRELEEAGENFDETNLQNLFAPIGLDIGADTPESIALSIIAEINSVLANRSGGFLRNRAGSIYNRSAA